MLELAVLGHLHEQDLHGYELKKRLTETLGVQGSASFGSLYPALKRLERSGAVAVVDGAPAARPVPSTGSLGGELAAFRARAGEALRAGRGRKVYTITTRGREAFAQLLGEADHGDDRAVHVRWTFARHLTPEARIELLERRRAHMLDRLTKARQSCRRQGLDRFTRALAEHGTETTERDISWLDGLIAAERDHASTEGAH